MNHHEPPRSNAVLLPSVAPRGLLTFAGTVLARPGATVEDIGSRAGIGNRHRRGRIAFILVEAGLCGLHGPARPGAKRGHGRVPVADDDRLSPSAGLARLDAAMAADDLDGASHVMLTAPFHAAVEACLAAHPRIVEGRSTEVEVSPTVPGLVGNPGDVANAFALSVALGRAWHRGPDLLDGRAPLPDDMGGALERAYADVASDGEAMVSTVLDRLCVLTRVSPVGMQRASGRLFAAGWSTRLRFHSGRGRDIEPARTSVLSGSLSSLTRRSVPLDHFRIGGAEAYVVREEGVAIPVWVPRQ